MYDPSPAPDILQSDEVKLLVQVGFLASGYADVPRAENIFHALMLFRPKKAVAYIGVATALMNAGAAGEAARRLEAIRLPNQEEEDLIRTFHGLALRLDGRQSESVKMLRTAISEHPGQESVNDGARLAKKLLGDGFS